jgi:putative ABC transport system ATP-binding protein
VTTLVEFKDVCKRYMVGDVVTNAVQDMNFTIEDGEFTVILGASGAGKSTVLNLLGGMDSVTSGSILVDGNDITGLSSDRLSDYRRGTVGFVFQFYNLIGNLNALENVQFGSVSCKDRFDASEIMRRVGLSDRMASFPSQLSGGEQQRVAIARAVAKNPRLLLCDEPTGALDYATSKQVLKLLADINRDFGKTVVMITHNTALAAMSHTVIRVRSGEIESIERHPSVRSVDDIDW